MLFNTAWNKTTEVKLQPELLSTSSLVAWLEKQPASQGYDYNSPHSCLLAKYFYAHGERDVRIGQFYIDHLRDDEIAAIPPEFYEAVTPTPHTYGAALKRLKAFV